MLELVILFLRLYVLQLITILLIILNFSSLSEQVLISQLVTSLHSSCVRIVVVQVDVVVFTKHVLAPKIFMSMEQDLQSKPQFTIKGVNHDLSSLPLSLQLPQPPTLQMLSGPPFLLLSHPSIGCLLLSSARKVSGHLICI